MRPTMRSRGPAAESRHLPSKSTSVGEPFGSTALEPGQTKLRRRFKRTTNDVFEMSLASLEKGYERSMVFRSTLDEETDRGCALMAAGFHEEALADLLRKSFVRGKAAEDLLQQGRSLGDFSAKIDLAYSLALIPAEAHQDLHLVREIRNDFAHSSKPLKFDERSIGDRCKALRLTFLEKNGPPRKRFTNAMMGLASILDFAIHNAKSPQPKPLMREELTEEKARKIAELKKMLTEMHQRGEIDLETMAWPKGRPGSDK
jgi:DNA-binding MltR family transcriptional regulator